MGTKPLFAELLEVLIVCGIVGHIGKNNARNIVINGLKSLEYRGYDSAGAAFLNANTNNFDVYKEVGRVAILDEKTKDVSSKVGIGHTRWATHGGVTAINAHPHKSRKGRFIIVHNGIIENYAELVSAFLGEVPLSSETDSEVIAQLIEKFSESNDVKTAIIKTLKLVHGSYALLVLDSQNPNTIYAAKDKPPLVVGRSEGEFTVTSDPLALVDVAEEYFVIEDKRLLIIENDEVTYQDYEGNIHEPKYEPLTLSKKDVTRGEFAHFMLKEIHEQPHLIRHLVDLTFSDEKEVRFDPKLIDKIENSDRLYIIAAGTSMHAGLVGKSLFEKLANIPVEVHVASEFSHNPPLISQKPLFVFISQSGETADLRSALQYIKKFDFPALTITNVITSTLAREADFVLGIDAAPEIAVAATKTYTGQVVMLSLLAYALSDRSFPLKSELLKISDHIAEILKTEENYKKIVARKLVKESTFFIGRGIDYLTSLEGSLKLKEISYIHSEAFPAGELKHGAIALIEKNTPVVAVISDPAISRNTRANISEVKARGAKVLTIVSKPLSVAEDDIVLPEVPALLSPILFVVATQLIAYYAALIRGLDIDKPRNLAKSVTVE